MKKIYPYRRKIYYYETDKMGIVHHSNYVRILEEARIDFLAQAEMSFEKIESMGLMMPILSVECHYKRPLTFGTAFAVYPKITKFNGAVMDIEYKVINLDSGELSLTGKSSQCFTDMNLKPIRTRQKYPEIYSVLSEYNGYEVTD